MINVDYLFESDEMTDEEYENQEEKTFVITRKMIIELIEDNVEIPKGMRICESNLYVQ